MKERSNNSFFCLNKIIAPKFHGSLFFLITSSFELFYILEIKERLGFFFFSLKKKKIQNRRTFSSGYLIFSIFLKKLPLVYGRFFDLFIGEKTIESRVRGKLDNMIFLRTFGANSLGFLRTIGQGYTYTLPLPDSSRPQKGDNILTWVPTLDFL